APNQPAYIIYTSGTAGMPKGITISHHSLLYAAKSFASLFPYPSCALMSSSISFDPSILTIIHALSTGGSVCLYENMKNTINYNEVTSLITRYKVNFIISTPSYYQQLLTESKSKKLDSLQNVIMCGENIPPKLIQDHQHIANKANLYNAYGPSEYAIGTTIGIIYDSSSKIQFSENIGVPFCKNKLYVLDEQLQHVPIGKKGEFYISGPGLAIGYYQQDSLTKERFFNHQIGNEQVTLYRTGDVGYQRHDGNFVFCERKNFHVKSNQNKVEKILNSCEAEEYKKLNRNTRATIIKQAPSHIGREKHDFEYFATVNTKPYAFRKSAQDYVKGLESDQSRRFKYLFDNVANHVAFQSRYILGLFKPDSSTSTLLDIGCGPGIIAKPLLPYYKQITGVDCDSHLIPVLSSLERKKNFSFVSGKFQDIIFGERYDHILCNHSIYYIPKRTWERSIKKMLSLLKDEGSILLVQTAPLGPIHDLREPISSEYPHSGHMHKLLQKMGIKYSTDVLVLQHPQPSRKAFKELIHMYMIDGCYPPDGYSTSPDYNNLTEMEKERLDNLVEGFVSGCYDYTKNAYVLHDVCHYIKIEKQ
ncbi:AMP-binding protein, partial [bacterium]|nr:AMP-binding protein [bacterium]